LFTVATVSVVVPEEDDWLGEHAANPASSRARPVSTEMTRALIFMADSSLGRNKKYDNRTSNDKYNRTYVRRKLFNSVEPSEHYPPFFSMLSGMV
jgi:hypothetical protein